MKNFWKKIISLESKSISSGAIVIALFYILNGLLGLLRNGLLAYKFGASRILDIYWASFKIPDLIYVIFISGALSAGFIPFFSQKLKQSKEEAWKLANNILSTLTLIITIAAFVVILLAPSLVSLIVPGFNIEEQNQVVNFLRIMMIQPIFLGISSILSGVLQTFRRFFITSLSPLFYNIGIIIGILFLTNFLGPIGLAYGVVLGSILHFLIILPALKSTGFHFHFLPNFKSENLKKLFSIAGPRTLSLISTQINFFVITIIASHLEKGSLAIFNFANDLQYLPQNVFAVSFAISAFPILSFLIDDKYEFNKIFIKTIKNILFFLIPISIFYFVFSNSLVGITLNYGNFDLSAKNAVSEILKIFSLGMIASSLLPLLIRVFFAQGDAYRPFFAGLSANLINIILSLILAPRFGLKGLTTAFVLSGFFNLFILLVMIKKRKIIEENSVKKWRQLIQFILIIIAFSLLSGLVSYFYLYCFEKFISNFSFITMLIQLILGGIIFLAIYCFLSYFFIKDEFKEIIKDIPLINKFLKNSNEKYS
jgi:putative peptidoglycan lipid II flippase